MSGLGDPCWVKLQGAPPTSQRVRQWRAVVALIKVVSLCLYSLCSGHSLTHLTGTRSPGQYSEPFPVFTCRECWHSIFCVNGSCTCACTAHTHIPLVWAVTHPGYQCLFTLWKWGRVLGVFPCPPLQSVLGDHHRNQKTVSAGD